MQQAVNAASEEMKDMKQIKGTDDSNESLILIIDDEMFNIDVVSGLLFSQRISSSYALSGQTALDLIEERINLDQQREGLGN